MRLRGLVLCLAGLWLFFSFFIRNVHRRLFAAIFWRCQTTIALRRFLLCDRRWVAKARILHLFSQNPCLSGAACSTAAGQRRHSFCIFFRKNCAGAERLFDRRWAATARILHFLSQNPCRSGTICATTAGQRRHSFCIFFRKNCAGAERLVRPYRRCQRNGFERSGAAFCGNNYRAAGLLAFFLGGFLQIF